MNEQEKLARQWAERIKSVPREYHDEMHHAVAEFILAHTTPETMEGVEWDDEKHYLAGADYRFLEDSRAENVVMLAREAGSRIIEVLRPHIGEVMVCQPEYLTPNGKRYKLVDATISQDENVADDQRDHPEILETVEDFEDAPVGTILLAPGERPRSVHKIGVNSWRFVNSNFPVSDMACAVSARTHGAPSVLWWGGEA